MSTAGETTFSRLGSLHCKCEWREAEEAMLLTLVHCETAWTARLDRAGLDLGNRAGDQDFMDILKEVFSGESENHTITLENDKLSWKKIHGKTKVKIAEIVLTEASFREVQTSFNEQLITENRQLKEIKKTLEKEKDILNRDNKKALAMLKNWEEERKEFEENMYNRFVPILNTKKEYIKELLAEAGNGEVTDTEDEMDDMDIERNKRQRTDE